MAAGGAGRRGRADCAVGAAGLTGRYRSYGRHEVARRTGGQTLLAAAEDFACGTGHATGRVASNAAQ